MSDLTIKLHPASLKTWQEKNLEPMRYDYPLNSGSTVLDLGAYNGDFTKEIFRRFGCVITAVEPTTTIGGPWDWIQKAASTHEGVIRMGGAFYYTSAFEGNAEWGFSDYPCFDVNNLVGTQAWDLVKINIEGAEYELLEHMIISGTIANIRYLQVQFHLVDEFSRQRYAQIRLDLLQTHACSWRYEFCWESWTIKI